MGFKNVRAVYFPYCLEKQEDGSWLLLNRNYKPVGLNTGEFIDYDQYPVSMKIKGLGPATLRKLSHHDGELGNKVFLYNGSCVPTSSAEAMSKYLKKLEIILRLKSA
ncbi:hypothetical protein P4S70_13575 [Enterovibrio sp. Hal110]